MFLRFQLSCVEYSAKWVTTIDKWWFILPLSCIYSWLSPLYLVLVSSVILLVDCSYRDRGEHKLIMYLDHPTISYIVMNEDEITSPSPWPVAYVEGTGNHITSMMVYPPYQGHGLGRRMLKDYLDLYAENYDTYWFKTSRSFDTFYMTNRLNMKKMTTNNWYNYKIECYK
jgi:GNAT superfamily N-acetyltransferase